MGPLQGRQAQGGCLSPSKCIMREVSFQAFSSQLRHVRSQAPCSHMTLPMQEAREQLDVAVAKLDAAGFETPDWEAAQHHWRLGRVLWDLGAMHHEAAKQAWLHAVGVEGPCQVRILASQQLHILISAARP